MSKASLILLLFFFVAIIALTVPNVAHAYLDPGSVSYVTQILIALLIGGLVAMKMFWAKIKVFLSNLFNKKKDDKDDD